MSRIFISYSQVDKPFIERFEARLGRVFPDIYVWYDDHLHGGDVWWEEILDQIARCDVFIYLLSNDSVRSPYCQAEFTEARRLQKRVITVQIRDRTKLTDALNDIQYVDMKAGVEDRDAWARLASSINYQLARAKKKRPRWQPRTPKPALEKEVSPRELPSTRRLEAATPREIKQGASTEVRVKISLPGSRGLRGELPKVTAAGDLIQKSDVESTKFPISFPLDKETGSTLSRAVCLKVSSDDFDVRHVDTPSSTACGPDQVELEIPPNQDSGTIIFRCHPKNTTAGRSQFLVSVFCQGKLAGQTVVSTTVVAPAREKVSAVTSLWTLNSLELSTAGAAAGFVSTMGGTDVLILSDPASPEGKRPKSQPLSRASSISALITGMVALIGAFFILRDEKGQPNSGDVQKTQTAVALAGNATPLPFTPGATAIHTATPSATPGQLETVLERALNFSGNNSAWEIFVWEFDGVEMVLVPAGCFMMGSETGEADETPVHQVCFERPFWIDRTEVTNTQFEAFNGQAANASYFSGDNHPREKITWAEAGAFCESRGARLPSEAEWEYAARGPDSWEYPWGDTFVSANVVWSENSGGQTASVGSKPEGASWVGALDMSGNVWEWTADTYASSYPAGKQLDPLIRGEGNTHSLRGGSWGIDKAEFLRAANRYEADSQRSFLDVGFRCTHSAG